MNVVHHYRKALAEKNYVADAAQEKAIMRLQDLFEELIDFKDQRSGFFKRMINRPDVPKGVYLWGGVGRGKSFLMDSFYNYLPYKRKVRIHFHEFMRSIHQQMQAIKGTEDPLDVVAKRTAEKYRLICFDEFHVSDIADAMILHRLLERLFEYGCTFVMTSNYEPSTLYPDGLHRDRILPAIALIKQKMDIINVDTGIDYRRRTLEQVQLYYRPLTPENSQAMESLYKEISGQDLKEEILTVENRPMKALGVAGNIAWFDFKTLCEDNRSQNDFLELATRFETIFLSEVPKMTAAQASPARRFTWLIDVLYDYNVKLVMSAEVEAAELYTEGVLSNEFFRTESRITEMQSKEYMQRARRSYVKL